MASQPFQLSEDSYKRLVESVSDYAIFIIDLTGHVISWNKGAQRIKGYSADEVIGK
jgi:PAS domain S-box-containing protein